MKMYGDLQRNVGPYHTVRIALYLFTQVLQVDVFLARTDERHKFTLLHMSGRAVHYLRSARSNYCH